MSDLEFMGLRAECISLCLKFRIGKGSNHLGLEYAQPEHDETPNEPFQE